MFTTNQKRAARKNIRKAQQAAAALRRGAVRTKNRLANASANAGLTVSAGKKTLSNNIANKVDGAFSSLSKSNAKAARARKDRAAEAESIILARKLDRNISKRKKQNTAISRYTKGAKKYNNMITKLRNKRVR